LVRRCTQTLEEFYTTKWNWFFRLLYNPRNRTVKEPFLRLAYRISNIMTKYFREMFQGEVPELPNYNSVQNVVVNERWALIHGFVPDAYFEMRTP
jgi:hypothetical protein